MITLNQYVANENGKAVDVDHMYGAQCWDNGALYSQEVVGVPGKIFPYGLPTGNGTAAGVYYYFQAPLPSFYTRVAARKGIVPKAGWLVVWGYNLPGSGGAGHIAICLTANSTGFVSFDQNWGGQYCHKVSHSYAYVVGYLVPRVSTVSQPAKLVAAPTYTIKAGDTLYKLAALWKTTVGKIVQLNPKIVDPNRIYIGEKIVK